MKIIPDSGLTFLQLLHEFEIELSRLEPIDVDSGKKWNSVINGGSAIITLDEDSHVNISREGWHLYCGQVKEPDETEYEVTWSMDCSAKSVQDAAACAFGTMLDPDNIATYLRISSKKESAFGDFDNIHKGKVSPDDYVFYPKSSLEPIFFTTPEDGLSRLQNAYSGNDTECGQWLESFLEGDGVCKTVNHMTLLKAVDLFCLWGKGKIFNSNESLDDGIEFVLEDQDDQSGSTTAKVLRDSTGQLWISAEGYEDADSEDLNAYIVALERYQGRLNIKLWDKDSVDPRIISLESAKKDV